MALITITNMKLYEFFGTWQAKAPMDQDEPGKPSHEEKDAFKNDLFFYILDNDDIHKKHFYEIASRVHEDKDGDQKVWMPMVNRGCLEYYKEKHLQDDPKDLFSKEFREDLCQLLDDHFRKDVIKGEYKH